MPGQGLTLNTLTTLNTLNNQNSFNQLDSSDNLGNLGDLSNTGDAAPGSGVAGQSGPLPDATPGFLSAIVDSVASFMPAMSDKDMLVLIAQIEEQLKNTGTQLDENNASTNSLVEQGADKEQQQLLAQAQQQIEAAAAATQNESVWDKVKMAFQIIAAVVMIAVGAALAATGVGAPLAAAMILGGVAALMGAINSTVQTATGGGGFMGDIVKACGCSAQQAQEADMGFGIAMAIVGLITAVATIFLPSSELDVAAEVATLVGDAVNAASLLVTAQATVASGVDQYDATNDNANADTDNASAKLQQAFATQINNFIKLILADLGDMYQSYDSTLSSITAALQRRDQSLIQAAV
jgi:hypothetical protein